MVSGSIAREEIYGVPTEPPCPTESIPNLNSETRPNLPG